MKYSCRKKSYITSLVRSNHHYKKCKGYSNILPKYSWAKIKSIKWEILLWQIIFLFNEKLTREKLKYWGLQVTVGLRSIQSWRADSESLRKVVWTMNERVSQKNPHDNKVNKENYLIFKKKSNDEDSFL